ncbi:rhomboid family intramembrane serine protease [Metapseudomonas otitidis]|uniref:rhomboid family intramembrane serine protease n=1 Tax=Metapseudomonas otitidis TaxID=319939 RepID=UPI002E7BA967|nr:rhomboid family intramembrane serine protease [Pseudomonas otitidis]MEE1894348.1 rhomboid family intramembrane serine protease [Pseudomonas otitidis]
MVILPAEHPLDWKRPPVVTLFLVVLNALIYFVYQGGDAARSEEAVRAYLDAGLLNRERALFVESLSKRHELDPEERRALDSARRNDLALYALRDLEFEDELHRSAAYQADPAWQRARAPAEAARDSLSSYRFGFIPKRFTVEGLFGAMFLHGSFDHLLGNMIFLFICGFALERALGAAAYLGLYLASGLASHLLWWAMDPGWVPGIGASGAVAGLMGMYIGVYALRRINFFYWLGPMMGYFKAPALWILPIWMGKELYGLLLANDHVNYYAHLGGLASGFLGTWLPRRIGALKVDEQYLAKEDPDAPFKRELAALEALIGRFALDQVPARGLDLLARYPGRVALLERLYPVARTRKDKPLASAVLKQVFALPDPTPARGLLLQMATDLSAPEQQWLQHPAVLANLLQRLLKLGEGPAGLGVWRVIARQTPAPAQLPVMTLALAKQLGQRQDLRGVAELAAFLNKAFPDAEQTRQLGLYRAHLAR